MKPFAASLLKKKGNQEDINEQKKAQVIILFGDILALLIFWIGYNEINQVVAGVAHYADSVEFNNRVGFFFIGVGLPITHLYAIYENYWPKVAKKKNALFNYLFLILIIVLFASGFFVSARVQTYVVRAGYLHCHQADESMSFSAYLVYTKDDAICGQLIEEKRKPRRY